MDLPKKIKVSRVISDTEKKGDFLNYTKRVGALSTMIDPLIDNRRRTKQSSYLSQVLTREQMKSLIKELRKIDVVYAVMAKVQFDTLLRIAELINHFPHTSNDLNPKFKCWGEMHVSGQKLQQFNFIGKGQVKRQIDIDIRTLKLLEDKYLTSKLPNSDITVYDERKQKFLTEYLDSKNGRKSRHNHDDDILWMSESGRPVSIGMYQEAFRQAGSKLKSENLIQEHVHVRPHAMRHTGATLRLIKYREETGVDIHVDNDGDIHSFLQSLLGHSSILTTHRYIRTVRATTFSDLAVKTIIRNEEIWDEELLTNKALKRGVDAIKGV